MRRKRIIRYFAVALVSTALVYGVIGWHHFFGCTQVVFLYLDEVNVDKHTSPESFRITTYLGLYDIEGFTFSAGDLPITEAYVSIGSFLNYESYTGQIEPVVEDVMNCVVKFDVPREGNWTVHIKYQGLECEQIGTYDIIVES